MSEDAKKITEVIKKEAKKESPEPQKIKKPAKKQADKTKREIPEIKPGMTVRVHQEFREPGKKPGEIRVATQIFEGIVLGVHAPKTAGGTIMVRKEAHGGIGVEKIFPLSLPTIKKIEIVKKARVRRAKLYFLRTQKKKFKIRKEK